MEKAKQQKLTEKEAADLAEGEKDLAALDALTKSGLAKLFREKPIK